MQTQGKFSDFEFGGQERNEGFGNGLVRMSTNWSLGKTWLMVMVGEETGVVAEEGLEGQIISCEILKELSYHVGEIENE